MNHKELGATEIQLPEIGLGTWQYKGGIEPLRKGMELGASHIDTAEMYGTEKIVGEAVKGRRQSVFIATKVSGSHLHYAGVLEAAEGSLERLATDYIDLYQVHWPNPRIPIAETMAAMETLVDAGKVRFIGVSNFSVREMKEAQAAMREKKIVSNQVVYSLLNREIERDLIPYCQENRITIIAYSPLGRGNLTSMPLFKRRAALRVLHQIASETGKTMAQVALNWCICKADVIAIPKTDTTNRIIENVGASGWRLSSEHLQALDGAF